MIIQLIFNIFINILQDFGTIKWEKLPPYASFVWENNITSLAGTGRAVTLLQAWLWWILIFIYMSNKSSTDQLKPIMQTVLP